MKQRQLVRTQPPQRFQPEPTRHRPGTDMHGHPQSMGQWVKWLHIPWVITSQVITPGRASLVWIGSVNSSRPRAPRAQSQGLPKDSLARFPDRWRSTQQSTQGTTVDFHVKRYETNQKQKRYLPWYWVIGLSALVKPMFVCWNLSKALDLPAVSSRTASSAMLLPTSDDSPKGTTRELLFCDICISRKTSRLHDHCFTRRRKHSRLQRAMIAMVATIFYPAVFFLIWELSTGFDVAKLRSETSKSLTFAMAVPFRAKVALWWESSTQLSTAKNCHARMHVTLVPQILQIFHASVRGWMPVSNDDGPCREATLESCKHLNHPTRAMLSIKPQLRINNYIVFLASFNACARKDRKGMTKDWNGA